MKHKLFTDSTELRLGLCMMLIFALAITGAGRVAVVASNSAWTVAANSNSGVLRLCSIRGTVYDTNMRPLTNTEQKYGAVILPTKEAIEKVKPHIVGDTQKTMDLLYSGRPAVCFVDEWFRCNGVTIFDIKDGGASVAKHIIGYTNSDNIGVSGIQQSYDTLLARAGDITAEVQLTALGEAVLSGEPIIKYDFVSQNDGVITTIDINVQNVIEKAAQKMTSGAIIVTEIGSGKIRGILSRPDYDISKINEALNDERSPLLNRALSAYNVGSVFKPIIAAAALENGYSAARTYNCLGSSEIGGRVFRCNNLKGHGNLALDAALGLSCNCYFYTLANEVGASKIHNTASSFPFGVSVALDENIVAVGGNLTAKSVLENSESAVANFAIGQGDLLLTPLSICTLYEAIANGGLYNKPTLIEGTVSGGEVIRNAESPTPARAFSRNTAETIKKCLINAVGEGTGAKAQPIHTTAGGKTATAETGILKDGLKVTNGWFCGFFPADNPKYVAVVMCEGAASGGSVCAPIFREIADGCAGAGLIK